MDNIWFIATFWMGLALLASLISIRLGISVALIEILLGVVVGNLHPPGHAPLLHTTEWTNFLAMLGSGVLTFLAGAEIDPGSLRANLRASLSIGVLSFLLPFLGVWLFCQYVLDWPLRQAQIAGIALSTTSVAVVYAVMIEGGLSGSAMGKMLLAACFITDFGTVLALGVLFADFNVWLVVFVAVTAVMLWFMPRWTQYLIARLGATRVSEPEVKFLFLVLFFLGGLASSAKSEAVLPAYLLGLVVAGVFLRDKTLVHRMRSIAFAIFTPFYFIKAGLFVSLPALKAGAGIIAVLLLLKMATKTVGVWPLSRYFFMRSREASYTALLMSTGLTFGTISALFGLQNNIINQEQYSVLVTVVILSAFVPTLMAQKWFQPSLRTMVAWGRLYQRRVHAGGRAGGAAGGK
ncbi:cation:proton antiporter [Fontisphaera persica]|uniref:cation:proton antiporter n=1 Tax=Fontisphaera persica TaxID=2974023 RepID=UPI0024C0031B|nr:cation:proton antiporter [Fontisphaera persica]WCJ57879.1 cation:proton antiporter [Fontisphaera persica]